MWFIDFLYEEDVIYSFEYDDYNKDTLIKEAESRIYHAYGANKNDEGADKGWFRKVNSFSLENWKQAKFLHEDNNGEDWLENYPETNRITQHFKNIIGCNDIRPRFYILDANTSVPEHTDQNTQCGINIILSDDPGPVRFKMAGEFFYKTALLNVSETHDVPAWPGQDRLLLKISIMDVDFRTAKEKLKNDYRNRC